MLFMCRRTSCYVKLPVVACKSSRKDSPKARDLLHILQLNNRNLVTVILIFRSHYQTIPFKSVLAHRVGLIVRLDLKYYF
jgi:hypothetical protein